MNDFLILFTLKKNKANIYEIKKFINTYFAPFVELSTGAIIPALNRLEKAQCVVNDKTMSDGGLRKTIYTITTKGTDKITEYLSAEIEGAYQLTRRETEICLLVANNEIFTEEQKLLLKNKIKFTLKKQITELKNAISAGIMNLEFLNNELIYTEAKLRMLTDKD